MITVKKVRNGVVSYVEVDDSNGEHIWSLVNAMLADHVHDHSSNPAGIVLGPREYISLAAFVSTNIPAFHHYTNHNEMGFHDLYGVPIYTKELPGIELLIDQTKLFRYV